MESEIQPKKPYWYREKPPEVLPDGTPVWGRNSDGLPICNGKLNKKPGQRCQRFRGLQVNGRCRLHGGNQKRGVESANFIHGKTSRYMDVLPDEWKGAAERVLSDKDYLSLREEIAVTSARIRSILQTIRGYDVKSFAKLSEIAKEAGDLLTSGEYDNEDLEDVLNRLIGVVASTDSLITATGHLDRTQEHLRKLVETEGKRLAAEQDSMPALRAIVLFRLLQDSVNNRTRELLLFLREAYPDAFADRKRPDVLRLVADDIGHVIPAALPVTISQEGDP